VGQLQHGAARRRLALVVSCTATKSTPPPAELLVRDLPRGPERLAHWAKRLREQPARRRLRELYAGPTWHAALHLETTAVDLGFSVDLWVTSAGLGLTSVEQAAPSYGATFAAGVDQVSSTPQGRKDWWSALHAQDMWGSPNTTLAELRHQTDQLLLVLSPTYLEVLEDDLSAWRTDHGVAVMSSGRSHSSETLSSSGLRGELGGTQMTLNTRAAGAYLRTIGDAPLGAPESRQLWQRWADERRKCESFDRRPLSDEAVQEFIRTSIQSVPVSRTRLLAQLRQSGWACEQSRFARLYNEVRTEQ
jgi:hypothetical protein